MFKTNHLFNFMEMFVVKLKGLFEEHFILNSPFIGKWRKIWQIGHCFL